MTQGRFESAKALVLPQECANIIINLLATQQIFERFIS